MPQVYERVPEVEEACYYGLQKNNSHFFDLFGAVVSISDEDLLRKKIEEILLEIRKVADKRFKFLLVRRGKLNRATVC
jgi:hypothetical protein